MDYDQLSRFAAEAIAKQLTEKPGSCFGLPSGRSPLGCYQLLAEWSRQGKLDWSQAHCFALDEYLGAKQEQSFARYFEENLYRHTNLPSENRLNPCLCDDYDALIASKGGLDLTMIGIGRNGHVAFNEPGTPENSWTHCAWLTDSTLEANASLFGGKQFVPKLAVTMGMKTILQSRKLILLASGVNKHEALKQALSGPVTTDVPASLLQRHQNLTVLRDYA